MTSKIKVVILGLFIGSILSASLFASGLAFGVVIGQMVGYQLLPVWLEDALQQSSIVVETKTYAVEPPEGSDDLFAPFWQAWDIVHEEYVDQPVDDVSLMRGAISGALDALGDPHTSYMDPVTYEQSNIPLQGSYEGIGAWVDTNTEFLTIVSPMPGSPAEEAGLQPGDEVVAVDGEDVSGVDANIVIRSVLGPAGTTVRLTIRREGEPELLEFEIIRAEILMPSVESEMLEGDIGYIRLVNFSNDTTDDLRSAIRDLRQTDLNGLILDLRGNGGGFLVTAIEVASEFIEDGVIMTERFGDGREEAYEALGGGLATDLPLIILVNGGSASASEIVAGAIHDYGRGLLVGETTFGKGSVQNWIALSGEEGAVRVTVARWYTPMGTQIVGDGLEPDHEVPYTNEDFEAGNDPQLEKAIELLTE
ncbi:MAG TPA: S41 family peptidase [Anaerolineales bacterium]|nr:S41 family peptidase [Anaerolineales bacterium]